jgi:beta-fructofuranosidase
VESLSGPFRLEEAYRLTDERLYVGRLVEDRAGRWQFLAFRNNDEEGGWVGEISDPHPVRWVDGRLEIGASVEASGGGR